MTDRKPLTDWVIVPRWVAEKMLGETLQQNLAVWKCDGPVLCEPRTEAEWRAFYNADDDNFPFVDDWDGCIGLAHALKLVKP